MVTSSTVKKAQKIVIKQFAYGTVRIDDGPNVTNKYGGGGGGGGSSSVSNGTGYNHYCAFGIVSDVQANGEVMPSIYLPPSGALVINGEDIQVHPLNGAQIQGQCLYRIPAGIDLWCAVTWDANNKRQAQLYKKADIPQFNDFVFHVAKAPRNLKRSKVVQYVYGTVFAYVEDDAFALCVDGKINGQPLSASARDFDSDDSSDSSEEEPEETPWDDYDPSDYNHTHHIGNGYYMMGGALKKTDIPTSLKIEDFAGKFVCLKVPATSGSAESESIVGYDNLTALQTAQRDPAYFVKPLYKMDANGKVEVDLRNVPTIQVAEVL